VRASGRSMLVLVVWVNACHSDLAFDSVGEARPPEPRWELSFTEECGGEALGDQVITLMRVGDATFRSWGSRADWMADEQVRVSGGLCTITAVAKPSGDRQFTSGVINTAGRFEQEFGRFEARLRFPGGMGIWPQWWLRSVHGWPPAIHVAGLAGHRPEHLEFLIWYLTEQGRQERTGSVEGSRWQDEFHVYRADWSEKEILFVVDDVEVGRLDLEGVPPFGPLYPIVNLSVHDGEAGPVPDETTPWPAVLELDWLRVYRRAE